jgi:hypothetical protein
MSLEVVPPVVRPMATWTPTAIFLITMSSMSGVFVPRDVLLSPKPLIADRTSPVRVIAFIGGAIYRKILASNSTDINLP